MNEERLRILHMVAEGKVNPEEAEGLLQALEPAAPSRAVAGVPPMPPMPLAAPLPQAPQMPPVATALLHGPAGSVAVRSGAATGNGGAAQRLRILLHGQDGDQVDVACPIGLAKSALHMMPKNARDLLEKFGVELAPILEGLEQGAAPGNLVMAKTEEGDEFQLRLE